MQTSNKFPWKRKKMLYESSDALIWLGIHVETNELVVIKDRMMSKGAAEEADMMNRVQSKYIVNLHSIHAIGTTLSIVMDFLSNGDLITLLEEKERFSEAESQKYFCQVAIAIAFMHKQNIAHKDIKPDNIFMDAQNNCRVGDFGYSGTYDPNDCSATAVVGTVEYAPPEAFLPCIAIYGPEQDLWSLGVLLFVMLEGSFPFWGETDEMLICSIVMDQFQVKAPVSTACKDLLNKLLEKNPRKRITTEELLVHPWVLQGLKLIDIKEQIKKQERDAMDLTSDSKSEEEEGNKIQLPSLQLKNLSDISPQAPSISRNRRSGTFNGTDNQKVSVPKLDFSGDELHPFTKAPLSRRNRSISGISPRVGDIETPSPRSPHSPRITRTPRRKNPLPSPRVWMTSPRIASPQ